MSLNIFWFLPTHGDGHYLGTSEGARAVDHGYLQQVAQAADRLGFGGVLPGASRPQRWRRKSNRCAPKPPSSDAPCASAFVCM